MKLRSIPLALFAGILPMMAGASEYTPTSIIHSISIAEENRDYYDASKPCNKIFYDLKQRNKGNGYVSETFFTVSYDASYQHGFGGKIYITPIPTDYCRKAGLGCLSVRNYWKESWRLLGEGDRVEKTWESKGCKQLETYNNIPGEQNVVFESFNCNGSEYYTGTRTIHVCTPLEE